MSTAVRFETFKGKKYIVSFMKRLRKNLSVQNQVEFENMEVELKSFKKALLKCAENMCGSKSLNE